VSELGWALKRAIELDTLLVSVAVPVAAVPLALIARRLVRRALGRVSVLGKSSRAIVLVATTAAAYVGALLLAQHFSALATVAVTLAAAAGGFTLLARGSLGVMGPGLVAVAAAGALPNIERTYFGLRTIVLCVLLGATILCGRELFAKRASAPVRGSRWQTAKLLAAWLLGALVAERTTANHPETFRTRDRPVGAMSATIEALLRAVDVDGDGHASLFGGRDCAPFDPTRSPSAHEIPNNGKDDNCINGDAKGDPAAFLVRELGTNPPPNPARGNAVIVIVDTMRADAVGPRLAAFAEQGRRFTRVYSSASFTAQSFVGILTGQLPTAAKYTFWSPHDAEVLALPPSMFRAAHASGYVTGMAGGVSGGLFAAFFKDVDLPMPLTMVTEAHETTDTAISAWHALAGAKPRLLVVHYLALHAAANEKQYRELALQIDGELARLFAALEDNAIWIVTADHGEAFGLHGVHGHSTAVYRDALQVPLVVRYPGIARGEEHAVTSLLGLTPTLLALIAPERLAVTRGPFFCLGQPGCGDVLAPTALEKPGSHLHSLIDGERHAIHDLRLDRRWEFDLATDPDELHSLTTPGSVSRRLEAWEELGFVNGARAHWFSVE
jgi:hypothetical protein